VLFNSTLSSTNVPHQAKPTTLEMLASRGIYPVKTDPQHPKDYYQFHCPLPGHADDHNPSFYGFCCKNLTSLAKGLVSLGLRNVRPPAQTDC
jgi:hypothetical protein